MIVIIIKQNVGRHEWVTDESDISKECQFQVLFASYDSMDDLWKCILRLGIFPRSYSNELSYWSHLHQFFFQLKMFPFNLTGINSSAKTFWKGHQHSNSIAK